ncbi:D-alanyl-D-alanine carboxypeptidase / D-alanyl-D-alanine-endopeptidase (penicillin-binding protein 4) [Desulfobacula phenolica]|uniref:D-alanyl-D-alanine carboxypeptidase / D-alanyl-D-alanine-endopeptidase (Penicillin-binding protein 4) n=1 Tax=Desulfobacula phenolica TaxID=90732 RepID=A0A1H2DNR7_9BACT|nr:D-alanyl-D-alanine carboxypeptidase / D-alanyl-D-alanine-endopeptidase (penicillin-binding protein 4) [Desulfobacula phenolica]
MLKTDEFFKTNTHYFNMKLCATYCHNKNFNFYCGRQICHVDLHESPDKPGINFHLLFPANPGKISDLLTAVIISLILCSVGLLAPPCIVAKNLPASIVAADDPIGIVLADDQGNILYSQNKDRQFIPASILKILTSLAAINILGQDYRFSTAYFFDKNSKNLYIKGFGDPLLISEVIEKLCLDIILTTKIKQIHHIILDPTYFSEQITVPGKSNSLNPYDAPVGALCANFNTIMFKWSSKQNRFVSAEPQTPLLSVFYDDINRSGLRKGRIILSKQQSLLYPGQLIKYFLEKNHIKITGDILQGKRDTRKLDIKEKDKHLFVSPFELKEIVKKLLTYSSNFIANQLLLTIGAKTYGTPATLEKGVNSILDYSINHLKISHLTLSEGSGLSRTNQISPDQMLKSLIEFMPFYSLLNCKKNDFFKTGTLSDVRTRAGYIMGDDHRLYPYIIMVNQKNRGYKSILKKLIVKISQITNQKNK